MNSLFITILSKNRVQKVLKSKPGEEGFSLVELVVVIAVLAILSAVAIPAFQGVQSRAKMAAVKNGLVNGVKECVVSAAINVGDNNATAFSVSQAYKGEYSGYTMGPNGNDTTCYKATATSADINLPNFQIQYDPNTGISQKWCDAGKLGCTKGEW